MKPCLTELTDEFLAGKLNADQEASFAEHLEICPDCRAQLESKSATPSEWKTAREMLSYAPTIQFSQLLTPNNNESSDISELLASCETDFSQSLSFLAPTDDPTMLGRIGTYEIIGLLGRGGTGIVLKGFDRSLNRNVALKVLDPSAANIGAARERFAREARAMAAITHEHVVPVYGVDVHQGLPYFVMEYVAGGSLDRRLTNDGPFDSIAVVRIGLQTAQALDAAHQQGLVHRDIKPGNILIDKGTERVRVADFGLARVANDISCTRSGFIAGTPQYMAPEQVRAESCDGRADLFSLGAVMYAMSTGHPPFRAESVYAVMQRIVHDAPRSIREQNPKIPAWLEQFIMRLLHKEKEQRFPSASEVGKLLQEELAYLQSPVTSNKPTRSWFNQSITQKNRTLKRKRRGVFTLIGMILFAVLLSFLNRPDATTNTPTAQQQPALAVQPLTVAGKESLASDPISAVPLWNNDKIDEIQNLAVQLESKMLVSPFESAQNDGWSEQIDQTHSQFQEHQNNIRSPFTENSR